jgi:phosphoribosylformylglycinamidine cyclo-ligase
VGRVVPERVAEIVGGIAAGCELAGCALVGGETAEHPGVMAADQFDLAGFCVGVVDEAALLRSDRVLEGNVLIGLSSSGLHSNGYSLVRRAMLESGTYLLGETPEGLDRPLGDELLEPTTIYAPLVLALARGGRIRSAAHITGGGILENLPRALPPGLGAEVVRGSWPEPPIFDLVRSAAGVSDEQAFAIYNMGIGLVLVVPPVEVPAVIRASADAGIPAFVIGRVVRGSGVSFSEA